MWRRRGYVAIALAVAVGCWAALTGCGGSSDTSSPSASASPGRAGAAADQAAVETVFGDAVFRLDISAQGWSWEPAGDVTGRDPRGAAGTRVFAKVTPVDASGTEIEFDAVQVYIGAAIDRAGMGASSLTVQMRDRYKHRQRIALAEDCAVLQLPGVGGSSRPDILAARGRLLPLTVDGVKLPVDGYYWMVVEDGEVTVLMQQYLN